MCFTIKMVDKFVHLYQCFIIRFSKRSSCDMIGHIYITLLAVAVLITVSGKYINLK